MSLTPESHVRKHFLSRLTQSGKAKSVHLCSLHKAQRVARLHEEFLLDLPETASASAGPCCPPDGEQS